MPCLRKIKQIRVVKLLFCHVQPLLAQFLARQIRKWPAQFMDLNARGLRDQHDSGLFTAPLDGSWLKAKQFLTASAGFQPLSQFFKRLALTFFRLICHILTAFPDWVLPAGVICNKTSFQICSCFPVCVPEIKNTFDRISKETNASFAF